MAGLEGESFQTYNRSKIQPASTVITDHYICNGTHMRVDDGQHCYLWLGELLHAGKHMEIISLALK